MNYKNLNDIFEHYIEQFEFINKPGNEEYYKWQIAQKFRPLMDVALASSDEAFPKKLLEVRNLTKNLIDSYLQPFYGLVKCAEEEPDAVRQLFLDLFREDGGDLANREERIKSFLKGSHALRDQHFEGSYLYTDDFHSVSSYLALYDPDHNYILKQTQSRKFAECIEYYDDWGIGEDVNLATYYKMCNAVAEEIKKNPILIATDASRFDPRLGWGDLWPDKEKHLLVFDLIFCSTVYDLYSGVSIVKRTAKERVMYEERKAKAKAQKVKLDEAVKTKQLYDAVCSDLKDAFSVGTAVEHFEKGKGTVVGVSDDSVSVLLDGASEPLKLGLAMCYGKGMLRLAKGTVESAEQNKQLLTEGNKIKDQLQTAEKLFAEYADDLE